MVIRDLGHLVFPISREIFAHPTTYDPTHTRTHTHTCTCTHTGLKSNFLENKSGEELARVMKHNNTLHVLDVDLNDFDYKAYSDIRT